MKMTQPADGHVLAGVITRVADHDFGVDEFLARPLTARVATNGPTVRPAWYLPPLPARRPGRAGHGLAAAAARPADREGPELPGLTGARWPAAGLAGRAEQDRGGLDG